MTDEESLMIAGKARWLLEGGAQELSAGERALLLALAQLEADSGRKVTEEEKEALDRIASTQSFDAAEIARAVQQMKTAEAKKERKLDWSEVKNRLKRKK